MGATLKILVVTRLMSGFYDSIIKKKWEPTGSPAIYKLIEALDKSQHILDLIFTIKESDNEQDRTWVSGKVVRRQMDGINSYVRVIPGMRRFQFIPFNNLKFYLGQLYQLFYIILYVLKTNPGVLYIDRSNVIPAAFLCRFFRKKIILRVLGVTPMMEESLKSKKLYDRVNTWAFGSSFSCIIGTLDGSDKDSWAKKALSSQSQQRWMLNGVDFSSKIIKGKNKPQKLNLIFVSRLEYIKNPLLLIDSIKDLPPNLKNKIHLRIVGDGSLMQGIKSRIAQYNLSKVIELVGKVPHNSVHSYFAESDLFISINEQGSISNASLEALKAGVVLFLVESKKTRSQSEYVLPEGSVLRAQITNFTQVLKSSLEQFITEPNTLQNYKNKSKSISENILSWNERINNELVLIEGIVLGA